MKRTVKCILSVLTAVALSGSLYGCGGDDAKQISEIERLEDNASEETTEEADEAAETDNRTSGAAVENNSLNQTLESDAAQADAGSDLDHIEPDPADDNWYMKGNVYKSDDGHYLEVFFNDEGMLEFAVDGLSLYYSHVDKVQYENNWRIYDCEDGTMIVYYPGEPAHLEIYDGDEPRLYEEGGDKVK